MVQPRSVFPSASSQDQESLQETMSPHAHPIWFQRVRFFIHQADISGLGNALNEATEGRWPKVKCRQFQSHFRRLMAGFIGVDMFDDSLKRAVLCG